MEKDTCGQFHPAPDRATTFHHSSGSQSEWFCSAKCHHQGVLGYACSTVLCRLRSYSSGPFTVLVARNGLSPRVFTACRRGTRSQMNPAHLVARAHPVCQEPGTTGMGKESADTSLTWLLRLLGGSVLPSPGGLTRLPCTHMGDRCTHARTPSTSQSPTCFLPEAPAADT